MKRKLDNTDTPTVAEDAPVEEPETTTDVNKAADVPSFVSFTELALDPRLVQAVAQQKFEKPTLVQQKAIPLALNGQDLLAKAKTGSGKTAAYVLPVLQAILKRKQVCIFCLLLDACAFVLIC